MESVDGQCFGTTVNFYNSGNNRCSCCTCGNLIEKSDEPNTAEDLQENETDAQLCYQQSLMNDLSVTPIDWREPEVLLDSLETEPGTPAGQMNEQAVTSNLWSEDSCLPISQDTDYVCPYTTMSEVEALSQPWPVKWSIAGEDADDETSDC